VAQTLFNQPNSSRSTKPWQPNVRLVSDDTGRGFASTEWMRLEKADFADAGLKPNATGFAQDRYQAVSIPLSEKSRKTLALMGETDGAEDFASDGTSHNEPESPNAHLPFVLDVYGAKPSVPKAPQATAPTSLEANTDLGIAADATEVIRDDAQTPSLDTEEVVSAHAFEDAGSESGLDVEATDAVSEQTEQPQVLDVQHEAESEQHAALEQSASAEQAMSLEPDVQVEQDVQVALETERESDLAESELITDSSAGEPQALGAEMDDVLAQEPVPPETPVLVGIDPQEVAQREAEQFERGLAQGIEQGERQAREAMQQEVAAQCAVLSSVTQDLNALLQDPKKFFEPMKRLALHVAEHVVMKELSTSTEAIERLIQRCLDELDHPAQGVVVVELNPQDKERLQAQSSDLVKGMRLDAVKGMKPGSVRLFANDTVVEDLVEHRLEALARSLLVDVEDWRAKSPLAQTEIELSESEVEDVEPQDVHP
jgi:flagellar biosynthesis/type III secretory pathway protein FliH